MVVRTDQKSKCPTNYALELFGDDWSLLVLRDMIFRGKSTFSEFLSSEERVSTNILASRLKSLATGGLIQRHGSGRDSRYSLTERGIELVPVMTEIILWSLAGEADLNEPPFMKRLGKNRQKFERDLMTKLRARSASASE